MVIFHMPRKKRLLEGTKSVKKEPLGVRDAHFIMNYKNAGWLCTVCPNKKLRRNDKLKDHVPIGAHMSASHIIIMRGILRTGV